MTDDPYDDELWVDEAEAESPEPTPGPAPDRDVAVDASSARRWSGTAIAQVVLVVLAVAAVLVVAVVKATDDDGDTSADQAGASEAAATDPDQPLPEADAAPSADGDGWPAEYEGGAAAVEGSSAGPAAIDADAAPGVYVWTDFDGWHLWLINGDGVAGVRGTIDSDKPLAKAELAEPGVGTVAAEGTSATFELPAQPRVSGLDLGTDFFAENLVITIDGIDAPIEAAQVFTGALGAHPAQLPLVIQK